MGSYQTLDAVRPRMQRGPVAMPVVNRDLVRPKTVEPVKKARVPRAGQGKKLSPQVAAEIVARRERGETYAQICEALDVSTGSVRRHAHHVPVPEGGWPNAWQIGSRTTKPINKEFAARLRRAGFSFAEIGKECGCASNTVRRILVPGWKRSGGKAPISDLIRHVAIVSGYTRPQLRKKDGFSCRVEPQTKARHIAFWLLRHFGQKLSYPAIGKSLGGYDHSTVIHGYRKADRVARALGVSGDMRVRQAVRALWEADWHEVGK